MRQAVAGLVVEIKDGGRITIPKPLRMRYDINEPHTKVEIVSLPEGILIRRYVAKEQLDE